MGSFATLLGSVPSTPPAPGAVPDDQMAPPVPAAPVPPVPVARPSSTVARALGDMSAIQAGAAQAANPQLAAYDAEMAKVEQAKAEQAAALQDKIAREQALLDQPPPVRPQAPMAKTLDAPAPERPKVSPLKTLMQMLPVLAALGTAKTTQGAIMALNAGTAVLKAQDEGDDKAFAEAHQQWLDGMKQTIDNNQIAQENYKNILENQNLSVADRMAELQGVATLYGDKLALAALKSGNPAAIIERGKILDHAQEQVVGIYKEAASQELGWAQLSETARANKAQEALAELKINKEPTATVQNTIGEILKKQASGQQLASYEQAVLDTYTKWRASGGSFAIPGMDGAGAPPTGSPPAAAADPQVPPVSALKEGMVTTFKNGQKWTLQNGKPVKVG